MSEKKRGTDALNRIQSAVWKRLPKEVQSYFNSVQDAMADQDQQLHQGLNKSAPGRIISKVMQMDATGDTLDAISEATHTDKRIITAVAAAAEAAIGGRAVGGANRLANGFTPSTRQSRGQGIGNRIQRAKAKAQERQAARTAGSIGVVDDDDLEGYSIRQAPAQQGDSGAAGNAMSRQVRQQIIDDYQTTNPRSGAVFSSSRRKEKELLKRGTREPSEAYIREQFSQMLRDKGGQAPPRQSTRPSAVTTRQETPREKQQRIRQAAQRNRESNPVEQIQELLKYSGSGSSFQESSIPKRPSTYRTNQQPIDVPNMASDLGTVPQHRLSGDGAGAYNPPPAGPGYRQSGRITPREKRRIQKALTQQQQRALREMSGRDFLPDGELRGLKRRP